MQLKQFFEKISICIITRDSGFILHGTWISGSSLILVAYDGKRGYRERTGKTCIFLFQFYVQPKYTKSIGSK